MITKSAPYSCRIPQKRPFFRVFPALEKTVLCILRGRRIFHAKAFVSSLFLKTEKTRAALKLREKIALFRRRRHTTLSFPRSAVLSFIRTTIITHFPLTFKRLRKINAAFIKSPGKRLRRKIGKGRRSSLKSAAPPLTFQG